MADPFHHELQTYISANSVDFTQGTNLLVDGFSERILTCVVLFPGGGESASPDFAPVNVPFVTVRSRGESRPVAIANWKRIFDFLDKRANYDLANYTVMFSQGIEPSPVLTIRPNNIVIYESNFKFIKKNT